MPGKYTSLNEYVQKEYGHKLYKLSLDGGCTCPNRDGTLGTTGCAFCSSGGSGDFTPDSTKSIDEQIRLAKEKVESKIKNTKENNKYIAYFQSFTNTYGDINRLRNMYLEVINREDIAILSIGTRPDCLSAEVLALLKELNDIKPVWVELGLQTIHEKSALAMKRGYELPVFDKAIEELEKIGVKVIVHLILFWPGETEEDMLSSIKYVCDKKVFGIKLQLLQILKDTEVGKMYEEKPFYLPSLTEYVEFLKKAVNVIPKSVVIHRLTGDGPKKLLIAPLWCGDKKKVMNAIKDNLS